MSLGYLWNIWKCKLIPTYIDFIYIFLTFRDFISSLNSPSFIDWTEWTRLTRVSHSRSMFTKTFPKGLKKHRVHLNLGEEGSQEKAHPCRIWIDKPKAYNYVSTSNDHVSTQKCRERPLCHCLVDFSFFFLLRIERLPAKRDQLWAVVCGWRHVWLHFPPCLGLSPCLPQRVSGAPLGLLHTVLNSLCKDTKAMQTRRPASERHPKPQTSRPVSI